MTSQQCRIGLTTSSTSATVRAFLNLTGFEFAEDKNPPFAPEVGALGVVVDVSRSAEGTIAIRNKQSRIDELRPLLDHVTASQTVVPCELPSFLGKLQCVDAQVWGRAGRMALRDLRAHNHYSRVPVSLDPSGLEALKLLRDRLLSGKPSRQVGKRSPSFFSQMGHLKGKLQWAV